jgi:hypothetical protein
MARTEIITVLAPAGEEPHPSRYSHTDVDGDRLLISSAVMPGNVPGIYFRTDPDGSSVPVTELHALIAQLQVIAEVAKEEAEAEANR